MPDDGEYDAGLLPINGLIIGAGDISPGFIAADNFANDDDAAGAGVGGGNGLIPKNVLPCGIDALNLFISSGVATLPAFALLPIKSPNLPTTLPTLPNTWLASAASAPTPAASAAGAALSKSPAALVAPLAIAGTAFCCINVPALPTTSPAPATKLLKPLLMLLPKLRKKVLMPIIL